MDFICAVVYPRITTKVGISSDKYQEDWKSRLRRDKVYFSQIFYPELPRVVRWRCSKIALFNVFTQNVDAICISRYLLRNIFTVERVTLSNEAIFWQFGEFNMKYEQ